MNPIKSISRLSREWQRPRALLALLVRLSKIPTVPLPRGGKGLDSNSQEWLRRVLEELDSMSPA